METMHTNDRVYRVKINDQNVKVTPYLTLLHIVGLWVITRAVEYDSMNPKLVKYTKTDYSFCL